MPGYTVFTRKDGRSAISGAAKWAARWPIPARIRGARRTLIPLWSLLDTTPEGRGTDWYPKLSYPG